VSTANPSDAKPPEVYILTWYGCPVVASKDFERLNRHMATFTFLQQGEMEIKELVVIT
jgi:hypothetical protein